MIMIVRFTSRYFVLMQKMMKLCMSLQYTDLFSNMNNLKYHRFRLLINNDSTHLLLFYLGFKEGWEDFEFTERFTEAIRSQTGARGNTIWIIRTSQAQSELWAGNEAWSTVDSAKRTEWQRPLVSITSVYKTSNRTKIGLVFACILY